MNGRGQFSIIASLLVAVVLVTTVIITYSTIRNNPVQDQPQIMSPIDETNLALKQVLGFTVGYYGSVLQVTGNSTYAKELAIRYLQNGTTYVANMHPEYGTSLNLTKIDMEARWFSKPSYSTGNSAVNYNLTALGIYGITYESSCKLMATTSSSTTSGEVRISVIKDDDEPLINLGKESFKFYNYSFTNSTWETVSPSNTPAVFANGTYLITVPAGIDTNAYTVQIQDSRGLMVTTSSFSRYTCTMDWNKTLYSTLSDTTLVVELLQNGTMRWLGQNLNQTKPVPPIPVRSIHVNQTINNIDQEVPFQIEDWTSNYKIPLGLANNASIFNSGNMLVFLVNPRTLNKTTIWWDGRDTATQTPQAYVNRYFTVNESLGTLNNTKVTLQIYQYGLKPFRINATVGTVNSTAEYMRINGNLSVYGSSAPNYAVKNGAVRVIALHEVSWIEGGALGCPNVYAQIVITLPANATYYTYQLRLMFAQSSQTRNITNLCPLNLTTTIKNFLTENGTTAAGYPTVSNAKGFFYNYSSSCWMHHWSQMNSADKGAGIMFADTANFDLYAFDKDTTKTGCLKTSNTSTVGTIELLPVSTPTGNLPDYRDITWNGAIVTFDTTTRPIYTEAGGTPTGLWILVEYPPTVTVEN